MLVRGRSGMLTPTLAVPSTVLPELYVTLIYIEVPSPSGTGDFVVQIAGHGSKCSFIV
jgi:hypothetical protein